MYGGSYRCDVSVMPQPTTDDATSARMSSQASRNTAPEVSIRSLLHRRGLRFRVHRRPLPALRREADIVFGRAKVAVFVDGCFWHACPQHGTWPKRNADFWRSKIEGNSERDRNTDASLSEAGWLSVRVWEHEPTADAVERIERIVRRR